jgi:hypothetical protein
MNGLLTFVQPAIRHLQFPDFLAHYCFKKIDIREKRGIGRARDGGDPIPWFFRENFRKNIGKNVGDNIAVVCHGASNTGPDS